jgi:hypothetical protein
VSPQARADATRAFVQAHPPSRVNEVQLSPLVADVVCLMAKVVDEAGKQPERRDDRHTDQDAEEQIQQ